LGGGGGGEANTDKRIPFPAAIIKKRGGAPLFSKKKGGEKKKKAEISDGLLCYEYRGKRRKKVSKLPLKFSGMAEEKRLFFFFAETAHRPRGEKNTTEPETKEEILHIAHNEKRGGGGGPLLFVGGPHKMSTR